MIDELMQLFGEGGGNETFRRGVNANRSGLLGQGLQYMYPQVPGSTLAQVFAKLEDDKIVWDIAQELTAIEMHRSPDSKYREISQKAQEFLKISQTEIEEASELLLDSKDRLRERFGISAWDAFWTLLHRAFREDISVLSLAQSMVRALDEEAA